MKATIFDIQRTSFVDGPGIRTTVFFKGCNLKCAWCHNPESQNSKKEILFYRDKCTGCGRCANLTADDHHFVCFNAAKEICGKEYTVDEIFDSIIKDKVFFDSSGGGVTFSGGECMLQTDFLCEILKKCKENGIHTAVDTAGHVPFACFERILPYADLFLYDVKLFNREKHEQYVGVGNELILENLKKLFEKKATLWIRIPIIPGVNDSIEEMQKIKDFLLSYGPPEKVELLPYHAMGENKYEALGKAATAFFAPEQEKLEVLQKIINLS